MQERQNHLSVQVARVKRKARPWKSIIALVLAIASAVISHLASPNRKSDVLFSAPDWTYRVVWAGTAVLFLIFGSMATVGLATQARQLLEPRVGIAYSAIVRYAILIVGAFTTLVLTLLLFGVNVSQLVLGGALTTVFVSIAAQQALGNVFAGLVVMLARPFRVGDTIRLRAGALSGTIDGTVTDIGITYVRVDTSDGVISVPNSQVLNAVVGPIPPDDSNGAQAPAVSDGKSGTPGAPEQPQPSPPGPV
ncbi:MAG: mechanosensitive ion channel family protein [Streptosporangiaceae bacterium]